MSRSAVYERRPALTETWLNIDIAPDGLDHKELKQKFHLTDILKPSSLPQGKY
jgi:hypothetical protein